MDIASLNHLERSFTNKRSASGSDDETSQSPDGDETIDDQSDLTAFISIVHDTTEPLKKKKKLNSVLEDIDLLTIIQDHPLGPAILHIYKCKKELCSISQSYLCDIIVTFFMKFHNW